MKTAGLGIPIGLLTFTIGLACSNFAVDWDAMLDFLVELPNSKTKAPSIHAIPAPSEEVQAEVIVAALANISSEDHNVTDDGRLYLQLSKSIFDRLPRKVNGIRFELLGSQAEANGLKVAATSFSNWKQKNSRVDVTVISYFYGGNIGGCELTFSKSQKGWKQTNSSCFAAAR